MCVCFGCGARVREGPLARKEETAGPGLTVRISYFLPYAMRFRSPRLGVMYHFGILKVTKNEVTCVLFFAALSIDTHSPFIFNFLSCCLFFVFF